MLDFTKEIGLHLIKMPLHKKEKLGFDESQGIMK